LSTLQATFAVFSSQVGRLYYGGGFYGQNPLHNVSPLLSRRRPVGPQQVHKLATVVVMEFGERHDTTDTSDFCPRQLVTNWCNGFWPLRRWL